MGTAEQFKAKVYAVIKTAEEMYDVDLSGIQLRYDVRGKKAGCVTGRRKRYSNEITPLSMRFNLNAALENEENWNHVFNCTIPHEVAHLVGYIKPHLASKHDYGWKRVCIALGGEGVARHSLNLAYANGTYRYQGTKGIVELSNIRHRKLQRGCSYDFVKYGLVTGRDWIRDNVPAPKPTVQYAAIYADEAAPKTTPKVSNNPSRSEQMRIKMRSMEASGLNPAEAVDTLIAFGMNIGLRTKGAARACVMGNLKDRRYTR